LETRHKYVKGEYIKAAEKYNPDGLLPLLPLTLVCRRALVPIFSSKPLDVEELAELDLAINICQLKELNRSKK